MTSSIAARLVRVGELPAAEENPSEADSTGNPLAPINEIREPGAEPWRRRRVPAGDRRGEVKQNYVKHLDLHLSGDRRMAQRPVAITSVIARYRAKRA
jgi:hypothetical protein